MYPNNQHPTAVRQHLLDTLDHLPGEPALNRERAWDTLQQKLADTRRRKIGVWYFAAAACLLLAIGLWLADDKSNEPAPAITTINKLSLDKQPAIQHAIQPATPAINKTGSAVASSKRQTRRPVDILKLETSPAIEIIKPDSILITGIDIRKLPDTALPEPIPLKKKLKVVHINQLNGPDFPPVIVSGKQARNDGSVLIRLN